MTKAKWNGALSRIQHDAEALRDDILEREPPTVAWSCALGALAALLTIVSMLVGVGYPGEDKTPTVS